MRLSPAPGSWTPYLFLARSIFRSAALNCGRPSPWSLLLSGRRPVPRNTWSTPRPRRWSPRCRTSPWLPASGWRWGCRGRCSWAGSIASRSCPCRQRCVWWDSTGHTPHTGLDWMDHVEVFITTGVVTKTRSNGFLSLEMGNFNVETLRRKACTSMEGNLHVSQSPMQPQIPCFHSWDISSVLIDAICEPSSWQNPEKG